jgi:hypothetical protein
MESFAKRLRHPYYFLHLALVASYFLLRQQFVLRVAQGGPKLGRIATLDELGSWVRGGECMSCELCVRRRRRRARVRRLLLDGLLAKTKKNRSAKRSAACRSCSSGRCGARGRGVG